MPRLRRADCSRPGITRRRAGRGFVYLDENGAKITDPEVLARIRSLAIPPAWQDVWICPWPNGHIQAVGTDARGRKQYRYHDMWRQRRDQEKFDHMLEFARALPALRQQCATDLATGGLTKTQVLACAVRLLDRGFFRIGTEGYAEQNQTYGLATIRRDHAVVHADGFVVFDYTAKSGKRRLQTVVDLEVAAVLEQLQERDDETPELLAYRNGSGWTDIRSADINAYIKHVTGGDFSAKDFRTWNATTLAAVALAVSAGVTTATGRKRAIVRAVKEVSHYLGNTPAVCRSSYIDPRVIDRFLAGVTIREALDQLGEGGTFGELSTQGAIEQAVLELLDDAPSATRAA